MRGKGKILIVDDEADIRELVMCGLEEAGFEVAAASDGVEAMEKIRSFAPHVVVLDVMMPRMDGWEVCKSVRDDPELARTRIVMFTTRATARDRTIGRHIFGADDYVTKPFHMKELIAVITRQLENAVLINTQVSKCHSGIDYPPP